MGRAPAPMVATYIAVLVGVFVTSSHWLYFTRLPRNGSLSALLPLAAGVITLVAFMVLGVGQAVAFALADAVLPLETPNWCIHVLGLLVSMALAIVVLSVGK